MALFQDIQNEPKIQNWLKGYLALRITKDGLRGLVEGDSKNVQKNIHLSVIQARNLTAGTTCGLCLTENLFQCHTRGLCSHPRNCKYHNSPLKINRPCPSQICDDFRDEICAVHRYGGPSWKNTKANHWCTNHWQVAKCFMPPDGYDDVTSYDETDFNGIISVMINCMEFQRRFSFTIGIQPPNTLTEAREIGRKIRHSPDLKVTDTDLADYFATLNTLLTDSTFLANDKDAQQAVIKLKQLEKDSLSISTEDARELLEEARSTIEVGKRDVAESAESWKQELEGVVLQGKTDIDSGKCEIAESVKTGKQDLEVVVLQSKTAIESGKCEVAEFVKTGKQELESVVAQGKTAIESGKCEVAESVKTGKQDLEGVVLQGKTAIQSGKCEVAESVKTGKQEIEGVVSQGKSTIARLVTERVKEELEEALQGKNNVSSLSEAEQREDLRQRLVKYYQKQLNSAPISPLLSHKDERLDKFYVPPKIVEKDHKILGVDRQQNGFPISSYKTIFCIDEGLAKNVFVVGEAGMGKTSFSAMCTMKWASQFSGTEFDFQDDDFLNDIEFMFHLKLRYCCETCELSEMIRDQLINMIYKPVDERTAGYDIVLRVLTDQKCVIIADGLDEWSHPETNCSCSVENKAIPHLLPTLDATVLITSRPWRMSRNRVKDTQIGKYFEIQGVASTQLLVQKVLVCLNERVKEKMKYPDFFLFVSRKKLVHLLSVPIIVMLLVCLWFEGEPESFSMCYIYAYMMDMMFGNKALPILRGSFESSPLLRCFEHTKHVQKYYKIVLKLAQLAFEKLFLSERKSSLVFQNVDCLTPDELLFVLKSGCMRETKTPSLIRELSSFSFIHKTVQEFLAAVHIASHTEEIQRVMKPYYKVAQQILTSDNINWENFSMTTHDVSKVFIYMCGLNSEVAHDMSAMMSHGILDHPNWGFHLVTHDVNLAVQETIYSGYREAKANNVQNIELLLLSFNIDYSTRDVATLKSLLSMNKSQIRHIQITGQENISEEELQEVFTNSTDALTIEIRQRAGQYDLSACSRLQHLVIDGSEMSTIQINTKSLESLAIYDVSEKVESSILQSLKQNCEKLTRFDVCNLTNTSLFCQTLIQLNHLEELSMEKITLSDNPLLLPPSVTIVILTRVTVSAQSLRAMLERVVNCSQTVRCWLSMCNVEPITDFEDIKKTTKIFSYC
ncbi:uncharacterized protein LOC128208213 [Mya arenaria]|uniref:uncharacterized protein LOC128208213 n=1 Tax=Mya arenaria TaxID=6604 RepID=UPI0022E45AA0|nr:uncharacterized protein LOC128208213 [Mya arenaria]XP_052767639.1 uncharacterized protein LOC128208213 [Mya arenaria]